MPKRIIIVTGLVGLALSVGCASIDRTMLKPAAEASRVPPLMRTATCVNYKAADGAQGSLNPLAMNNPFFKHECEEQSNSPTEVQVIQVCDSKGVKECAAYLERVSESICTVHMSKIFGDRAVTNMTLGTLATATGIAGGLVTGGAANALSGSAGFLTANRSLFNEEIYRNYVAEAVIKEIQKNRETAKNAIAGDIAKAFGNDAEKASPQAITGTEQVIQRVTEMHEGCSFYAGLSSLLGKAGKEDYAVNLKTGLSAQIDALKSVRADLVNKKSALDGDTSIDERVKATRKAEFDDRIEAIDRQVESFTLNMSYLAPGHVSEASGALPVPVPVPAPPAAPLTLPVTPVPPGPGAVDH